LEETLNYAMKYARGQTQNIILKFVNMYVNDKTIDMGENGKKAITKIFELATQKHLLSSFPINFC
jgi:1,4-dihydroxy-6-naphthoate synthase